MSEEATVEDQELTEQTTGSDDTAEVEDLSDVEEDQDGSTDESAESEDQQEDKPSAKWKKSIDRLTRQKYEKDRVISQLESENEELRKKASKTEKPVPGDEESYEDYIERLAEHKVREVLEKKELESSRNAQRSQADQMVDRGIEKYPDFEEVIQGQDIPLSPAMSEVIFSDKGGHDIAYFFGKNPDEAHRINQLPAIKQVLEIGKIQARLSKTTVESIKRRKKQSGPLPEVNPNAGGGQKEIKNMETSDYVRERRAELKKRRA